MAASLAEMARLRVVAWTERYGSLFARQVTSWSDEHDAHAHHFGVRLDERLVASARFCVHDDAAGLPHASWFGSLLAGFRGPFASLNRCVVAAAAAGTGLARALDDARIDRARTLGARAVVATTHGRRREALLARGFAYLGESRFDASSPLTGVLERHGEGVYVMVL